MSTPIFDLEVMEDYQDLPILREADVYLMESFVKGGGSEMLTSKHSILF